MSEKKCKTPKKICSRRFKCDDHYSIGMLIHFIWASRVHVSNKTSDHHFFRSVWFGLVDLLQTVFIRQHLVLGECVFFIFYDFPFRIKSVSMHLFNCGDDLNRVCTWENHDFFQVFCQASMVNRTYDYTKFKENNNKILEKKVVRASISSIHSPFFILSASIWNIPSKCCMVASNLRSSICSSMEKKRNRNEKLLRKIRKIV